MLGRLVVEAGIPPGVLNLVHGAARVPAPHWSRTRRIKAISFTGSTRTGAAIASVGSAAVRKVSLELGGKNPYIVFADADFERAWTPPVPLALLEPGQICLCGSRILVQHRCTSASATRSCGARHA